MTSKKWLMLLLIVLAMIGMAISVSARAAGDSDGDGLPDTADQCPAQPGPRENGGCPIQPDQQADSDGDGVADFVDECPDQPGTGFTNGCPFNLGPIALPTDEPQHGTVEMIWDRTDICMVGVPLTARSSVNVRQEPSTSSPIVGTLAPGDQYPPYFRDYDQNGNLWFAIQPGWVADSVVIDNGMCVNLPMVIHVDAPKPTVEIDPNTIPLVKPDDGTGLDDWLHFDPSIILILGGDVPPGPTPQPPPNPPDAPSAPFHLTGADGNPINLSRQLVVIFGSGPNPPGGLPPGPCLPVGGGCMVGMLVLPPIGDGTGQCPMDEFIRRAELVTWGDPHVVGLLLPAVQKVREAASRTMGDGSVRPGGTIRTGDGSVVPGETVLQDFHFLLGDGSVMPSDPCSIGLLLPAVQQNEGGGALTLDTFLIGSPKA